MQLRIWGAIGLASLGWGTNGVATRASFDAGVEPYALVAIRSVLATMVLLAVILIRTGSITRDRSTWRTGLVMSVLNLAIPFILLTLAFQYASAGFVGLLAALIPLATALLAHFVLPEEPLHMAKVVGLFVAFAGVGLLIVSGDSGLAEGGRPTLAFALALAGVLAIAFAGVYAKLRAGTYDPVELTWIQFTAGGVILVIAMLAVEGMPSGITTWGWTLIIYMTLAGSVLPFLLFYWLLRHVSATQASLIGYVVPLIALTAGIILLDERLEFGIAVGGVLILGGVFLTNRAERRFVRV